jgi:hypothetical protein
MTTTGSMIDYEALQQEAMRGVVRGVLNLIAKSGLPGEHHFYISFLTQAPGVILSKRLKEKYPHEMTIVLQHRFWDLIVSDERFEVKLTFDGIPERLVVPFSSIKVFIDPSVRFGLQFEDASSDKEVPAPRRSLTMDAAFDSASPDSPRATLTKKRTPRKTKIDKDAAAAPSAAQTSNLTPPTPEPASAAATPAPRAVEPADAEAGEEKPAGAKILSLDQFRKK